MAAGGSAERLRELYTRARSATTAEFWQSTATTPTAPHVNVDLTGNGVENVAVCVPVAEGVSINSTSQNGCPDPAVGEVDTVLNGGYRVLAINDLGMHCGDLDTRISSILPPFHVLHAQVIERGASGRPRVLDEGEVELFYSAASNPD